MQQIQPPVPVHRSDLVAQVRATLNAMWEKRWTGLAVASGAAVLGSIVLLFLPDRFEASARVYVDTQTVLKPLMTGLAVQPDIDQQVQMVARTLVARPNVEQLIANPNLGFDKVSKDGEDKLVDQLMKDIKITGNVRENLYSISYRDPDPARAEKVVSGLVDLFVESGLGNKRRDSADAKKFIDEQIRNYETKLTQAENRLKDFKQRNIGFTPPMAGQTSSTDYYGRVSTLSDDLTNLRGQLRAAEQGRDAIRRELAQEQPTLLPDGGVSGPVHMSESDTRLEALHKQLDDLLRRFTEQHPDVQTIRRQIAQLETEKKSDMDAIRRGDATKDGMHYSTATNPVFQRLRISLADAEANVASLQSRVHDVEGRLGELRAQVNKQPQVEAEYAQLNRDYDVIRKNYDQLVTRRESASMSESVDQTSQLADFKVVEPPRVAPRPVFPNRLELIPLLLLASLAAGVATTFGLINAFPTFHTTRALRDLTQRPVLGSVSMIVGPSQVENERRALHLFLAGTGILILFHLVWVTWTFVRSST